MGVVYITRTVQVATVVEVCNERIEDETLYDCLVHNHLPDR